LIDAEFSFESTLKETKCRYSFTLKSKKNTAIYIAVFFLYVNC